MTAKTELQVVPPSEPAQTVAHAVQEGWYRWLQRHGGPCPNSDCPNQRACMDPWHRMVDTPGDHPIHAAYLAGARDGARITIEQTTALSPHLHQLEAWLAWVLGPKRRRRNGKA